MVAINEKFLAEGAPAPPTGTQLGVSNLYQGMTLDSVTGLYDERFRNYDPSLGRWINQDPAGYVNGSSTYQYVESNPAGNVDASGERFWGWVGTGAAVGGLIAPQFVPGVDIVVDASGAIAVSGFGATAGGIGAGTVTGGTAGALAYHASITNPFKGRPGSSLPSKGPPNGSKCEDRGNGNGTIRDYYDDEGNAKTDNDFGHDHPNPQTGAKSGDPHAPDWVNGHRGPSRPLGPGE